jgi:hypothetical protein
MIGRRQERGIRRREAGGEKVRGQRLGRFGGAVRVLLISTRSRSSSLADGGAVALSARVASVVARHISPISEAV